MHSLLPYIISIFVLLGCSGNILAQVNPSEEKSVFEYTNPIRNGIDKGMRDCQIFFEDGKYYLTGTSYPFWYWGGKKNPGIKLYSSSDLTNWKFEKLLIDRSQLDSTVWYLDRFWAPEIHKIDGLYYLLFNCQNESTQSHLFKSQHCGVAVSDQLLGPYQVMTHQKPLVRGNDLTFFTDSDSTVYAFYNRDKKIWCAEIDLQKLVFTSKEVQCISAGNPENKDWDQIGIEGAFCIKNEDTYYLFYSSWSRGYEIGIATARHPMGPWEKAPGNPIYGAQNKYKCERYKLPFTSDENNPWAEVGHNAIFTGPDGKPWLSCHGILKEERIPYLVIDPIRITKNGIIVDGPTYERQRILY